MLLLEGIRLPGISGYPAMEIAADTWRCPAVGAGMGMRSVAGGGMRMAGAPREYWRRRACDNQHQRCDHGPHRFPFA